MNDLNDKQQLAVRTALRFLRFRVGAWAPIAKALRLQGDSLEKIVNARRSVTASVALRVAQFADVTFDLINGRSLSSRVLSALWPPPKRFQGRGDRRDRAGTDAQVRGALRRAHEEGRTTRWTGPTEGADEEEAKNNDDDHMDESGRQGAAHGECDDALPRV
jgi:hypothetical protein